MKIPGINKGWLLVLLLGLVVIPLLLLGALVGILFGA